MKGELPQKVENFKKEVAEMKELEISLNRRLKWYIMERNTGFFGRQNRNTRNRFQGKA